MSDLLAARSLMAASLAFHIIFAVIGMAMPLFMVIAEGRWLRTGDPVYRDLAQRWSKGTAVLFAVGAVSGTVLSFELGLLWPHFMAFAGPVFGLPFALEGAAFFLEAIFLGIYIYGWDRVPARVHWLAGLMVAISGTASGVFVVTANAWMNVPTGFVLVDGRPTDIAPLTAMLNPASLSMATHMTLAAFQSVGFAVAGVHAWMLLRAVPRPGRLFHLRAMVIALGVGSVAAVLQLLSGDVSAKHVAEHQPVKLAAMEAQWETERGAPLRIGGWPDEDAEQTHYSLELPYMLSFLAFADFQAEVRGLKAVPRDERPPVAATHLAFQLMVGAGMALAALAVVFGWLLWRHRARLSAHGDEAVAAEGLTSPLFLRAVVVCSPLGMLAVQAGWVVTEVGRQPWIIRGVMRTSAGVTPMPALTIPLAVFTLVYAMLGVTVVVLMRRLVLDSASPPAIASQAEGGR